MNEPIFESEDTFQYRATYKISIKGFLDNEWSNRLAGMQISHFDSESGPISTLTGKIIDQSELFGVLNTLNDYQYNIISVNKINN